MLSTDRVSSPCARMFMPLDKQPPQRKPTGGAKQGWSGNRLRSWAKGTTPGACVASPAKYLSSRRFVDGSLLSRGFKITVSICVSTVGAMSELVHCTECVVKHDVHS